LVRQLRLRYDVLCRRRQMSSPNIGEPVPAMEAGPRRVCHGNTTPPGEKRRRAVYLPCLLRQSPTVPKKTNQTRSRTWSTLQIPPI